jgi:hypothetical protein
MRAIRTSGLRSVLATPAFVFASCARRARARERQQLDVDAVLTPRRGPPSAVID